MLFFVTKYFQIALDTGPDCDPDQRDSVDISKEKETLRKFISKKFLKVDPEPSIEESCIYTVCTFVNQYRWFFFRVNYSFIS